LSYFHEALNWQTWQTGFLIVFPVQFDSEKPDKITRGACACNDVKVFFEHTLIYSEGVYRVPGMNLHSRVWDGRCPAPGGLSKQLHARDGAETEQSITLLHQRYDEVNIV